MSQRTHCFHTSTAFLLTTACFQSLVYFDLDIDLYFDVDLFSPQHLHQNLNQYHGRYRVVVFERLQKNVEVIGGCCVEGISTVVNRTRHARNYNF